MNATVPSQCLRPETKASDENLRRIVPFLCASLALLCSGCVYSVHPPYTEADLVANPAILGTWAAQPDENEPPEPTWTVTQAQGKTYRAVATDISEDGKTYEFDLHLFRIRNDLYLDVFPTRPSEDFCVRTHVFFRVNHLGERLEIQALDYAALDAQLTRNPRSIAHLKPHNDIGTVFTAPTLDLQRFLRRHSRKRGSWDDPGTFVRAPSSSPPGKLDR